MLYLILIITGIVSFFLWASIHEVTHFLAVKHFRPNATGKFKLYPHRVKSSGRFVFAFASWEYTGKVLTNKENGWIYLAPRIPSLVGIIITILISIFLSAGTLSYILLILTGGSAVDMFINSLGINERSDIQIVSRAWEIPVSIFRIVGLTISFIPILFLILFLL